MTATIMIAGLKSADGFRSQLNSTNTLSLHVTILIHGKSRVMGRS